MDERHPPQPAPEITRDTPSSFEPEITPLSVFRTRERTWREQVADRFDAGDGPWRWD